MSTSSVILTVSVPVFLFLAGLAFNQPDKYLYVLSKPLGKIANIVMLVLIVYGISLSFFIFKAKDAGLDEESLNSIYSQMWSLEECGLLFLSVSLIGNVPRFIAEFTNLKEK
ncbi:hypothetical protein EHW61_15705 [Salinivibrio sp. VYel6]|uniref:hypothetical protein n=1 Tax=Salinivibrio sp. VYel6 TaxID=2490493 RepID=UPI00128E0DB7|nr:hypothetical protein [Salinivibrio sp. VYel6]MPX98080.1 hypothetical protein [Salinivibrio sp. VYel6]